MNLDEQLKELAQQRCPRQVDVVEPVMAQVRRMGAPTASRNVRPLWPRLAVSSAAAVIALVVINLTLFRSASYNVAQIGSEMAYVSDYSYYSSVESAAENPVECLYDDIYYN
jgi:hypothetical protein